MAHGLSSSPTEHSGATLTAASIAVTASATSSMSSPTAEELPWRPLILIIGSMQAAGNVFTTTEIRSVQPEKNVAEKHNDKACIPRNTGFNLAYLNQL